MSNETDRELLELAAKAAGLSIISWAQDNYPICSDDKHVNFGWCPLVFDSDALRLAVVLGLVIDCSRPSAGEPYKAHSTWQDRTMSAPELTRRSITLAAAKIGKQM